VATLGRSYLVVADGFEHILSRLPFAVREIHTDNGAEFLNHHMLRFWPEVDPAIHLSRSRPYQKNDSRFVEQKNSTLVRAYLGYQRLDTIAHTRALNHLYDKMWLYYFDRLCATDCLDEGVKVHLERQRQATNPRQLRQEIYADLLQLSRLPLADPTQSEDVYQTLFRNTEAEVEQLFLPKVPVRVGD
jgi:transposase InsO family protein